MKCPHCNHENPPASKFCNNCGRPFAAPAVAAVAPMPESASARSIVSLILGILSIFGFGFLTGIPAMVIAKHEEDLIRTGRSSVAGEMLAKLGFWLGLIGTILSGLLIAFIFFAIFSAISIPLFMTTC